MIPAVGYIYQVMYVRAIWYAYTHLPMRKCLFTLQCLHMQVRFCLCIWLHLHIAEMCVREWFSLFFWEHVRAITLLFISESLSVNEEGHMCARMHCIVECTYSKWGEVSWFRCSRVCSYMRATFCLPANTLVGILGGLYLCIHTWGAHFKCLWTWWREWYLIWMLVL